MRWFRIFLVVFLVPYVLYGKLFDLLLPIPELSQLRKVDGVIYAAQNVGNAYLELCLDRGKECFRYPSDQSWRLAQEVLKPGVPVSLWVGGEKGWIWQLEYNQKELMSYRMKKWQMEGTRKLHLPLWGGVALVWFVMLCWKLYQKLRANVVGTI
jgi:hypothetical protein